MNPVIILGKYTISESSPCFIIAEIGHNHQGDLETAKKMFRAAAESGAHAVKLQKRSNRELFTRDAYNKPYENENSYGKTYGLHREALEFGEKEYRELKTLADSLGIVFFATPFDIPSVNFLEKIGVPCYKIASAMINDLPLIEYVASKGKPVIISTGGATFEDVDRAYKAVRNKGAPIILMQCTAAYPQMDYKETHLNVFHTFRKRYPEAVLGFSSHDSGIMLPVAAYMVGSRVVEKHFTLNRAMKGTDHSFSLEPVGLKKLSRDLARLHESLGSFEKFPQPSEKGPITKMSSFYTVNDQIKQRDFWMPFAPSMIYERHEEYIENPNKREAPYMILAFRSTARGKKDFVAAMHQGDHTLRPQLLHKQWNPGYYKLIKEFESLSGIGGVLNTSLNLHGYPLVNSPMQAIHVMDNSKLEYLAIEDLLVTKR